ncbi:phage tail tape measure protein [Paenibacillus thiaminolyticus]|uniref:phage tail tape measure protein n=1 Tax=Paenibacillus thiaminolyticus TaxID=49283 RepID=UPI0013F5FF58|nr:phage tail tape measure protein [Paenibacillus thiaminolyticus]NGP59982.1 phage tail tape measure protein [Paenibacillus thiaminolyticus]
MKNIHTIVGDLSEAFGRLTDGDKLAAAQRIFGTEAATAWLSVIKEGPEALREFTEALENSDAAARMAEIMNNTTAGKIKLFLSEVEGMWIDFMKVLPPKALVMHLVLYWILLPRVASYITNLQRDNYGCWERHNVFPI